MNQFQRVYKKPTQSFFLFGPRGVGKSSWLKTLFTTTHIDLLNQQDFLDFSRDPHLLAARLSHLQQGAWVCIDEVQKIPELLDEVHALIENHGLKFILSGSSARKLKRGGANLLAGRALTCRMETFVAEELGENFNLERACEWGTLPLLTLHTDEEYPILKSYVSTYLKEEIQAEGFVRNLGSFNRFLEIAGLINGQQINIENLARDAGVKRHVMHEYLEILEDTLLIHMLPSYRIRAKVREAAHSKLYWFDPGVAKVCAGFRNQSENSEWLGYALETYIFHELRVYFETSGKDYPIAYYQTPGSEIDFIIETRKAYGKQRAQIVTLEVKWSNRWKSEWEKPSRSLAATGKIEVARMIGLYRGTERLTYDGFEVWPVTDFLKALYLGKIFDLET